MSLRNYIEKHVSSEILVYQTCERLPKKIQMIFISNTVSNRIPEILKRTENVNTSTMKLKDSYLNDHSCHKIFLIRLYLDIKLYVVVFV